MLFANPRVCGGGPQADDDLRLYERELGVQPWAARDNFCFRRFLVNAPLAALFEFEVLDGIGDVNIRTVDACLFERAGQQTAGGSDKRLPRKIFLIARLLAYHHDAGTRRAFTENRLSGVAGKVTTFFFFPRLPPMRLIFALPPRRRGHPY